MIDLHYWTTPNGHKITMFLEESGLEYKIIPVNISKGEQFEPDFLAISPNNRIPAIVDDAPDAERFPDGEPVSVFESGAILLYLAEKTGKFLSEDARVRNETLEWLMWQMGGFGPMLGQNHHFGFYAKEKIPYAIERYRNETTRLYGVLDRRLDGHEFIVGEYSIADMACYPWVQRHERQQMDLNTVPNVKRWYDAISERPATVKAYAIVDEISSKPVATDEESRKILFGQK